MTAKPKIQWMVEGRALIWPWCGMLLPALSALLPWSSWSDALTVVRFAAFAIGVPVLATLPFGHEFQRHAMDSLLSQPISRESVWRRKSLFALGAVISAASIYVYGWSDRLPILILSMAWIAACLGSSALASLTTRSLIGGVAITVVLAFGSMLPMSVTLAVSGQARVEMNMPGAIGAAAVLFFSATLFLFGRRAMLGFQATGADLDSVIEPGKIQWPSLRLPSGRSGAVSKLIRTEIGLLAPLWAIAMAMGAVLFAYYALGFRVAPTSLFFAVCIVVAAPGISILAGCLSIGRESEYGTYAWKAALPVSLRKQWAIKLASALLANLCCIGALLGVGALLSGDALLHTIAELTNLEPLPGILRVLAVFSLVTLASFWGAAARRSPVEGFVLAMFAAVAVLLARDTGRLVSSTILSSWLSDLPAVWLHPYPFYIGDTIPFFFFAESWRGIWVVVALAALFQSYRLFLEFASSRSPAFIRQGLVLVAIAFICGVVQQSPFAFSQKVQSVASDVLLETARAVTALQPDPETPAGPLSLAELGESAGLSSTARLWLADASLTMYRERRSGAPRPSGTNPPNYFVGVTLAGGWFCELPEARKGEYVLVSCRKGEGRWTWWTSR